MNKQILNKRIILFFFLFFASLGFVALSKTRFNHTCVGGRLKSIHETIMGSTHLGQTQFIDLNKSKSGQGKVLILTPLKNAAPFIARYMELIDQMTYPKHLISIAFLVSDTTDDTVDTLRSQANVLLNRHGYDSITIFEKDFNFSLPKENRHSFDLQPLGRSYMARSRNYLLSLALRYDHDWVLWLDIGVINYPNTILHDLQNLNVDIVVPNCFRLTEDGTLIGYDKNNWQDTDASRQLQISLDPVSVKWPWYKNNTNM